MDLLEDGVGLEGFDEPENVDLAFGPGELRRGERWTWEVAISVYILSLIHI